MACHALATQGVAVAAAGGNLARSRTAARAVPLLDRRSGPPRPPRLRESPTSQERGIAVPSLWQAPLPRRQKVAPRRLQRVTRHHRPGGGWRTVLISQECRRVVDMPSSCARRHPDVLSPQRRGMGHAGSNERPLGQGDPQRVAGRCGAPVSLDDGEEKAMPDGVGNVRVPRRPASADRRRGSMETRRADGAGPFSRAPVLTATFCAAHRRVRSVRAAL